MVFSRGVVSALAALFFLAALINIPPAAAATSGGKLLQPELLERNGQEPVRVIALLKGWESLSGVNPGPEQDAALRRIVTRLQESVLSGPAQELGQGHGQIRQFSGPGPGGFP